MFNFPLSDEEGGKKEKKIDHHAKISKFKDSESSRGKFTSRISHNSREDQFSSQILGRNEEPNF